MEEKKMVSKMATMIEALKEAQKVFKESGKEEFDELRYREKKAVYDTFRNRFDGDFDGDSDYCYARFGDIDEIGVDITFYSNVNEYDDIYDTLDSFKIHGNNYHNAAIAQTIEILEDRIRNIEAATLPLGLLNTSILTAPGQYRLAIIGIDEAKDLMAAYGDHLDSAIGHAATAEVMTRDLGCMVPTNRQMFAHKPGQIALVFKFNGRIPEGSVLDVKTIDQIGYTYQIMERIE